MPFDAIGEGLYWASFSVKLLTMKGKKKINKIHAVYGTILAEEYLIRQTIHAKWYHRANAAR